MKIFALYVLHAGDQVYGKPIIYSTDIRKLRGVMLSVTGSNTCHIGTTDVTNEPQINCHTQEGVRPYGKIVEVPTLI